MRQDMVCQNFALQSPLLLRFSKLPCALSSHVRIVNATIDASKTGAPISKNIYGQDGYTGVRT